jgi:hypothetical protein
VLRPTWHARAAHPSRLRTAPTVSNLIAGMAVVYGLFIRLNEATSLRLKG